MVSAFGSWYTLHECSRDSQGDLAVCNVLARLDRRKCRPDKWPGSLLRRPTEQMGIQPGRQATLGHLV